jgi:lysophospholipid acyltransferase (LPLAT)-like uncharacterized protein
MPFSRCHIYIGEPLEVTTERLTSDVLAREQERLEAVMHSLGAEKE